MELPKNITQIGESDRNCKIYVEDYVISYIKQTNQLALNKEMAVALYGVRKREGSVTYLFVYGAVKLDFLQREVRHLSQAQSQEVERQRRKYFQNYEFLGYCLLNGEMVEGFHVCEQEICRYVTGYAQFYEKNDSMLAYMLETRAEEVNPEVVDEEKYDRARQRQAERRTEYQEERRPVRCEDKPAVAPSNQVSSNGVKRMRLATVAVFGLLCLAALATLGEGQATEDLQVAARQVMNSLTEQKIPDAEEAMSQNTQSNTLIAEDKLTEALQQENATTITERTVLPEQTPETVTAVQDLPPGQQSKSESTPEVIQESILEPTPEVIQESTSEPTSEVIQESTPESTPEPTPSPEPVSYTIREGDTLIGICINTYGSDTKVSEICSLNQISDADDIKVGQKILLP